MIAREWKCRVPEAHSDGFTGYLYETGIKDSSETPGFLGAQIFRRFLAGKIELTLITYWDKLESITAFAGENISQARLYPEDEIYELEPDLTVQHYEVIEHQLMEYQGISVPTSVVQEEDSGCGIASVANILGKTYSEMKAVANSMGIHAADESLWSDTHYVRRMLADAGVQTLPDECPFESWESLPDLALLSIKHHQNNGKNFWHWVVFKRVRGQAFVLDSASYLPSNVRQDFAAMQPKWFIEVKKV